MHCIRFAYRGSFARERLIVRSDRGFYPTAITGALGAGHRSVYTVLVLRAAGKPVQQIPTFTHRSLNAPEKTVSSNDCMALEYEFQMPKVLDCDVLSRAQLVVRFLGSTVDTCGGDSSCAITADDGAHCPAHAMMREQLLAKWLITIVSERRLVIFSSCIAPSS